MRLRLVACGLAVAFATVAATAHAPSYASGTVKAIRTGWNNDAFAVVLNVPQKNPANCPNAATNPEAGYVTDGAQPGFKTYYQAVLAGYAARGVVTVVIDNEKCVSGWPRIIGVDLPR